MNIKINKTNQTIDTFFKLSFPSIIFFAPTIFNINFRMKYPIIATGITIISIIIFAKMISPNSIPFPATTLFLNVIKNIPNTHKIVQSNKGFVFFKI